MSQLWDMLKIYGLFIASIMTLLGAIFIGAGLSSGSATIALAGVFIGGVMAFIGLGIIWGALKKPRPRPYGRYPYYPQYPGYQQYYPYPQYQQYPPYYQQPQYPPQPARATPQSSQPAQPPYPPQQAHPSQPPHRSYPTQSSQPPRPSYPAQAPPPSYQRYPTQPAYPPSQPSRQGYPPQQPYRQSTRPPPPPDYRGQQKSYQPVESQEHHITDEGHPPPPDYSQISRDPHGESEPEHVSKEKERYTPLVTHKEAYTPAPGYSKSEVQYKGYEEGEQTESTKPKEGEHVPVVKEHAEQGPHGASHPQGQPPPPSAPHKVRDQAPPPPPPYEYQPQYPQTQGGYRQGYQPAYQPYPQYPYPYQPPYPPGYGAPQKEAKLELPNILTLFIIFVGAIFIGALGLYIGGPMILFFPIAFIIAFSFPSFMWISYVYKKDVHEPEPRRVVLIALTFGFLSTILAIALSIPFVFIFPSLVVSAVIVAPLVEEFCKASGLRLVKSEINAEIDGVIYGVTIGMGFAMVENFLYELGFLFEDPAVWTFGSLLRGLGSTIGHGLGAGMIGYAYASYHMNRDRPGAFNNVILAYIAAVGLHALWNGVAVLSGENAMGLVVIVLIAVAEVVILKTLVSIARDRELQRRTEGLANEPAPGEGRDNR